MNKICTSLEQSKRLIELGIDRKTSDMYYWCGSDLRIGGYKAQDEELDIPAWSLSALLRLTPNDVSLLHFEDAYQAVYDVRPYYITNKSNNPLDAVFEMVCWLKENNKI